VLNRWQNTEDEERGDENSMGEPMISREPAFMGLFPILKADSSSKLLSPTKTGLSSEKESKWSKSAKLEPNKTAAIKIDNRLHLNFCGYF
jgi:hypothetical protein